jgi:hypothetical protein
LRPNSVTSELCADVVKQEQVLAAPSPVSTYNAVNRVIFCEFAKFFSYLAHSQRFSVRLPYLKMKGELMIVQIEGFVSGMNAKTMATVNTPTAVIPSKPAM